MKYLLLALSLLVASLPAAMADEIFPVFVNGQPAATVPLFGSEKVPLIQNGVTKTLPPYLTIGGQNVPFGGSTLNQGNGTKIQLGSGPFVNGHCLQYDAYGNSVDSGNGCGGGGGSGTVASGTTNSLGYYASTGTTISGLPTGNAGILATSSTGVPTINTTFSVSVTQYGTFTTASSAATNTATLNAAMTAVSSAGGGAVLIPNGAFLLNSFTVPNFVAITGQVQGPFDNGANPASTVAAPTLLVNSYGTNGFVNLTGNNSIISDVLIFDPNQVAPTASTPTVKPAMIFINSTSAVRRVTLVNAYIGINIQCGRTYVEDVKIGSYSIGLLIDGPQDNVYLNNISIGQFYDTYITPSTVPNTIDTWVMNNGTGIHLGRMDSLFASNIAIGAKFDGIVFADSTFSSPPTFIAGYGKFVNVDMDTVVYGVDAISTNNVAYGWKFVNMDIGGNGSGVGPSSQATLYLATGGTSAPTITWEGGSARGTWAAGSSTYSVNAGTAYVCNVRNVPNLNCSTGGSTGYVTVSADNTCGTDVTSTINAALATGETVYIPKGCYKVTSDLIFTTKNQILFGDGPGCYSVLSGICTGGPFGTVLYANSNAGFTHGVLYFNSGEEGPQVKNIGISLAQPDTATRGSLTAWVPAIYARNQSRFILDTLKIDGCIVCVDMQGNAGGAYLHQLQLGGYGTTSTGGGIIMIDGSLDTVRITDTHIWDFDMTSNQQSIFINAATVGINSGRMDDLKLSNLLAISGTGINFFWGTGGPGGTSWATGPTFGTISGSSFDSYNGIVASGSGPTLNTGPNIAISSTYFSLGTSAVQAMNITAGNFQLASVNMQQGFSGSTPAVLISDTTGTTKFNWASGYFLNAGNDVTDISVQAYSGDSGTTVNLSNIIFYKAPNIAYSRPVIDVAAGPRVTLQGLFISDKGTGAGTFINVPSDTFHVITGNSAPGWTLNFPASQVYGIYTCNTTGASPACGGGSGAVSSVSGSGAGISVSPTTGGVVVTNTGVTSISAGTGTAVSGSTGAVSVSNTGVTSNTGGSNIIVSGSSGASTISLSSNPTVGGNYTGANFYGPSGVQFGVSGGPQFTAQSNGLFLYSQGNNVVFAGPLAPLTPNTYSVGTSVDPFAGVYADTFYGGSGATAGVSCSGTPTSSFASVGGIVTHC